MPLSFEQNIKLETVNDITDEIFYSSIKIIDDKFGEGYSLKNPALLSTVISVQENVYNHIIDESHHK